MKSLSYISLVIAIVTVVLSIFVISDIQSDYKSKEIALTEYYRQIEEENDILYSFIENIDTFKTLDDAIESSQDLMDYIQFDYE